MRFSSFIVFAIASASAGVAASAAAERRTMFSCTTVGKSLVVDVDNVYATTYSASNCDLSMKGSTETYSAVKCPGCEIGITYYVDKAAGTYDVDDTDGRGHVTFIEPPASLGCSQAEIDKANPCVTSSITEESSMTSTSTSTETSTGSTVTGTSGATARVTKICIGAIALVGAAFAMM